MDSCAEAVSCLNCGATDADKPLLLLRLTGSRIHIWAQCLPALIHHPDRLTEKRAALNVNQR